LLAQVIIYFHLIIVSRIIFKECACSLSNKALLGAIGMVMTSAEDSRVTVALIIAHEDMFTAYPVGVKVKVISCRALSLEEVSVIPPAKMLEGVSRCLSLNNSTTSVATAPLL
jgi:hypothetical protein